jgi:hypothetical protein
VTALKQRGQHFSSGRTTGRMCTDQDSRIQDNSQPAGL